MTRVSAVGEQTSLADRKRRAGQRMLIGFAGPSVDEDLRYLVREIRPAGFVLFGRNVVEPGQVRELNRELASLVDPRYPALLAVDQEGGRVQRIREPATVWPPMREVGRGAESATPVATALSRELRAMGFHLNFAPVADVDSNPKNPVIGDRSFSRSSDEVAQRVREWIEGARAEGIASCAKHFPGHGDTRTDSHVALPVVERELRQLQEVELPPFAAAVEAGCESVMTAHVVFPALDPDWPATLSERVVPTLLRDELGFDGVVFSDDMEMKAVAGRYPLSEQVRRATRATVDVFLWCNEPALQAEAYRTLVHEQETSAAVDRASRDALARLHRLRLAILGRPQPPLEVVGCEQHGRIAHDIRARALRG